MCQIFMILFPKVLSEFMKTSSGFVTHLWLNRRSETKRKELKFAKHLVIHLSQRLVRDEERMARNCSVSTRAISFKAKTGSIPTLITLLA